MKAKIGTIAGVFLLQMMTGQAGAVLYSFDNITNNDVGDVAIGEAQLFVEVADIGNNKIRFEFMNNGPNLSSITNIYFEDNSGAQLSDLVGITESSGVDFIEVSGNLGRPPGGQSIGWGNNDTDFRTDPDSPVQPNGINPNEWLIVDFGLINGVFFADVIQSLNDKDWRIAFHVQGFASGGSESFVNNSGPSVPEPTTMLLFGTGIAGLAGIARRKRD